jgi:hypothetical protein
MTALPLLLVRLDLRVAMRWHLLLLITGQQLQAATSTQHLVLVVMVAMRGGEVAGAALGAGAMEAGLRVAGQESTLAMTGLEAVSVVGTEGAGA